MVLAEVREQQEVQVLKAVWAGWLLLHQTVLQKLDDQDQIYGYPGKKLLLEVVILQVLTIQENQDRKAIPVMLAVWVTPGLLVTQDNHHQRCVTLFREGRVETLRLEATQAMQGPAVKGVAAV